ncbi:MAG TPA: hypothetical protein PLH68_01165, partial [Anaerolineaceae bacterium]|nr:hypothetical protein [Anaerolineaceae bacterium]
MSDSSASGHSIAGYLKGTAPIYVCQGACLRFATPTLSPRGLPAVGAFFTPGRVDIWQINTRPAPR